MKNKKVSSGKWKKVLSAVIFVGLLIGITCLIIPVFERKHSKEKLADFFSQEEDFDVLFFGSSHTMNAIYPMELWNKYGIVSYNLGNSGELLPLTYWNLRLATKYHKPKLAVVDVYGVVKTMNGMNTTDKQLGAIHDALDAYPISWLKSEAIADIFREKNSLKMQINFLFNFSTYHGRWEELTRDDFSPNNNVEKGANARINVTSSTSRVDYKKVPVNNITGYESERYLRKIIAYCKEQGIQILLTMFPYGPTTDERVGHAKYYEKLAADEGVDYLNFLAMDPLENQWTDYYDAGHLNPSGAKKISEYVGKYIMKNYEIPNRKNDENYAEWIGDYNRYVDFKISLLRKNEKKRENFLILLAKDEDIYYEVAVNNNYKSSQYPSINLLLSNLDRKYIVDKSAFSGHQENVVKIVTYDKRNNKKINEVYF